MKTYIHISPSKIEQEVVNYYNLHISNKIFDYLLLSPLKLRHLVNKRDSDIIDFILEKYDSQKEYDNLILFNEILGVDGKLVQPLNSYILKTVTDYIKSKSNYQNLLINEYQIITSLLTRQKSLLDLVKYLDLDSVGLQFHYKTIKCSLALPALISYLNIFKKNSIKVHLTEVSIWEPDAYLQNKVYKSLKFLAENRVESLVYWYLLDNKLIKDPYKNFNDLPGLCRVKSKELINDYPTLFFWKNDEDIAIRENLTITNSLKDINWDNYLIKKPIFEEIYAK